MPAAEIPARASVRPAAPAALWLCADMNAGTLGSLLERVRAVLAVVDACVWLRPGPEITTAALLSAARGVMRECIDSGSRLVIGDRIDVAIAVGAHGVHLGGRSVAPLDARRLLDAAQYPDVMRPFISVAVHDAGSVVAQALRADTLLLSPLHGVPGKGPALGIGGFAALVAAAPAKPFIALGGILTPEHARDAACAGASGIAVRRALIDSDDPVQACRSLLDAFVRHSAARAP